MALSERERKLLAEMEAALATDDPRLQSTLAGDTATLIRRAPGRVFAGIGLFVAGIAILFTGLIAQITLVGIAGFIVALIGTLAILRSLAGKTPARARGPRNRGSLNDRLQERWDRRTFE
jgi:hypothetical protein